jgi:hypothetical protein
LIVKQPVRRFIMPVRENTLLAVPDPPIRVGLSRLACGPVLLSRVDMGRANLLELRGCTKIFHPLGVRIAGFFSDAQTHQVFAHRLALVVRA